MGDCELIREIENAWEFAFAAIILEKSKQPYKNNINFSKKFLMRNLVEESMESEMIH